MSYQSIMFDFFQDFDISNDIYGNEEDKRAKNVKTLIQNKTLTIANIRKDVNAVITLEDHGTHHNYNGFDVEIIHKDNGLINSQWFGFKEYLPMNCQVGNEKKKTYFHVWGEDQKWYGSAPDEDESREMVAAIMKHIGMWA